MLTATIVRENGKNEKDTEDKEGKQKRVQLSYTYTDNYNSSTIPCMRVYLKNAGNFII